jgi:hypothetical protein
MKKQLSKIELFKELGNFNKLTNRTRIVNVKEFNNDKYICLCFGNGASWCRNNVNQKYNFITMNQNGKINIMRDYSYSNEEINKINIEFGQLKCSLNGNKIEYIQIYGLNIKSSNIIRKDIKEYYINQI